VRYLPERLFRVPTVLAAGELIGGIGTGVGASSRLIRPDGRLL
jgi:hypothetical protein